MRVVTDEHAGSLRAAKWGMGDMAQVLRGLGSGFNFDRGPVLSCPVASVALGPRATLICID